MLRTKAESFLGRCFIRFSHLEENKRREEGKEEEVYETLLALGWLRDAKGERRKP